MRQFAPSSCPVGVAIADKPRLSRKHSRPTSKFQHAKISSSSFCYSDSREQRTNSTSAISHKSSFVRPVSSRLLTERSNTLTWVIIRTITPLDMTRRRWACAPLAVSHESTLSHVVARMGGLHPTRSRTLPSVPELEFRMILNGQSLVELVTVHHDFDGRYKSFRLALSESSQLVGST